MPDKDTVASVWAPRILSILRIVAALLYIEHGTQKLFLLPGGGQMTQPVELFSLAGFAGVLECIGGLLLLLGLFTRGVAFILSGEMAVAYFKVHAPQDFWPLLNKGEIAVLYCFLYLYFAFAGGGTWSLDAVLSRRRNKSGVSA